MHQHLTYFLCTALFSNVTANVIPLPAVHLPAIRNVYLFLDPIECYREFEKTLPEDKGSYSHRGALGKIVTQMKLFEDALNNLTPLDDISDESRRIMKVRFFMRDGNGVRDYHLPIFDKGRSEFIRTYGFIMAKIDSAMLERLPTIPITNPTERLKAYCILVTKSADCYPIESEDDYDKMGLSFKRPSDDFIATFKADFRHVMNEANPSLDDTRRLTQAAEHLSIYDAGKQKNYKVLSFCANNKPAYDILVTIDNLTTEAGRKEAIIANYHKHEIYGILPGNLTDEQVETMVLEFMKWAGFELKTVVAPVATSGDTTEEFDYRDILKNEFVKRVQTYSNSDSEDDDFDSGASDAVASGVGTPDSNLTVSGASGSGNPDADTSGSGLSDVDTTGSGLSDAGNSSDSSVSASPGLGSSGSDSGSGSSGSGTSGSGTSVLGSSNTSGSEAPKQNTTRSTPRIPITEKPSTSPNYSENVSTDALAILGIVLVAAGAYYVVAVRK